MSWFSVSKGMEISGGSLAKESVGGSTTRWVGGGQEVEESCNVEKGGRVGAQDWQGR